MSLSPSEPSDIAYLRESMNVFRDIRKASIIIADSIRVRERCALRGIGFLTDLNVGECTAVDMSDPVRCPICIGEFHDPTVVSRICGHGMHKSCAERQIGTMNSQQSNVLCSICRSPYGKADLVQIKGVLPPVGNAIEWRSVYLTEPWRDEHITPESTSGKESLDGCLERLLVSIRALFTKQNDFSRAINVILNSFDTVRNMAREDYNRLHEEKDALREREQLCRQTELRETYRDVHNEQVAASCASSVRNQEASLLRTLDGILLQQRQLQRTIQEVKFKEEELHDRLRNFEERKKEHDKTVKETQTQIAKERAKLSRESTDIITRPKRNSQDDALPSLAVKRRRKECEDDSPPNQCGRGCAEDVHVIPSSPDSSGVETSTRMKRSNTRNRRL